VTLGVVLERFGYAPGSDLGLRIVPLIASGSVALGALVFTRFPRDVRSGPAAGLRPSAP
jgi:hypothetical protein